MRRGESGRPYWSYASTSQVPSPSWLPCPLAGVSCSLCRVCFPTEISLFVKALFPKSELLSQGTLQLMMSMETIKAAMLGLAPGATPGQHFARGHCSLKWSQAGEHRPSSESQGCRSLCRCLPQLPSPRVEGEESAHILSQGVREEPGLESRAVDISSLSPTPLASHTHIVGLILEQASG